MQYRREIDGLRAIAVLPVILFHAGFSWFSGGYIGVDVFFVISGYLITSILLNDLDKGTFSIVKFYERRARRILPALFFVMLCCIPFAWMWMIPQEFKNFSQALVAISLFSSNILFWKKSGYFDAAAEENPLLHTWSLAVEEQFYIIFPILLLILWRFGKRSIFYVIVFMSLLSLLLAEYGWRNFPDANFYLVPTRAWELGVGAICAFMLYRKPAHRNSFVSLLGLGLIGYSIFFFDEATPFPSVYGVIPVLGTALVILFADNKTLAARLISNKFFVGIGLISFSAYLWHQPLLAFARIRSAAEPGQFVMFGLSVLSLIMATFTWKYVEQPFRTKSTGFSTSRNQIFIYSALGTALFVGSGIYGHLHDGVPSRLMPSGQSFAEINFTEKTQHNYGLSIKCKGEFTMSPDCRTGDKPTVMIWGDSFAKHLVQGILFSESGKNRSLIQFTKPMCPPILGITHTSSKHTESWSKDCINFNDSVMEWLSENNSVEYVILSSPMSIIFNNIYTGDGSRIHRSPQLVMESINNTSDFITNLGKRPIFISSPPRTGSDLSTCATHSFIFSEEKVADCSFLVENFSERYTTTMEFLNDHNFKMPVIDLARYLCRGNTCETLVNNINIYNDKGHLSIEGSRYIGEHYDLLGAAIRVADDHWKGYIDSTNPDQNSSASSHLHSGKIKNNGTSPRLNVQVREAEKGH